MASKVINLTRDSSRKNSKRSKSASPSIGKSGSSTSIIDSILKDRANAPLGKTSPGKKLIIDLAKDNFILTDAKAAKNDNLSLLNPQPIKPLVSKPIDRVVIDVPPAKNIPDNFDLDEAIPSITTSGKKSTRKSPAQPIAAGSLGNSIISREKMNKMKALDAVFLSSTPSPIPDETKLSSPIIQGNQTRIKSADPLDFIFNDETPAQIQATSAKLFPIPSPIQSPTQQFTQQQQQQQKNQIHTHKTSDIKIIKSGVATSPSIATISQYPGSHDNNITRQKLESVNRNIAKIQLKINEKGAKEKFAAMLKDLEKQKQKYETRLAAELKPGKISPQPQYPPPTYNQTMLENNISLVAHQTQQNSSPRVSPTPGKPKSSQPQTNITELAKEEQIATDRELARIRELFPDTHKLSKDGTLAQNQQMPKEVQSLFNVSANLQTLKEKQKHLEQQHKKMEEKYAYKLKQLERMRTQKEEMTKLSALEIERRKIYEMEQKLKRLDKEQWEEQQRLRKELQTINLGNLQAISGNNNRDVGEFYALKQSLSTGEHRTTSISPASQQLHTKQTATNTFRLVDWFAGFMAINNHTNKKYNPEIFKEIVLGQQPICNTRQKQLITGYHYYNTELPSTAWIDDHQTSTNNSGPDGWQDYQLGYGQMAPMIKRTLLYDLNQANEPTTEHTTPILEIISQISNKMRCPDTILTAKGLDFLVDKLNNRTDQNNIKLLDLIANLISKISSRITILEIT